MREKREFKIEGWTLVAMYLAAGAVIAFLGSIAGGVNAWLRDEVHLSGWVQAFGSIAAILGAIWVSQRQQDRAAAAAERAARHRARAFAKTIRVTSAAVTTSMWGWHARGRRLVLEECSRDFTLIDLALLPEEWIGPLLALRALALQIAQHLFAFESTPDHVTRDPRQIGIKLDYHFDMLKRWMADLQPEVDQYAKIIEQG